MKLQGPYMFTRNLCLILFIAACFACASSAYAQGPPPGYTPAQLGAIREAQIRISENRDAVKDGDVPLVSANARIVRIMTRINANLPASLSEAALMEVDIPNVMPRMATDERKQSFFSGVNFLKLGLIAVFTVLTLLLIGKHLIMILVTIPKVLWEIGAYTSGIGLLAAQSLGYTIDNQFLAFFACLLIGGGLYLSVIIHADYFEEHSDSIKMYVQYVCPVVMLAAFGAATLITGSDWMGGFAAVSLMVLLGFAGEVIPLGYAIGFRDNDALARGTSAGLILTVLFMGLHAANITNPVIRAFDSGALIVGGFVCYLGLLIAASARYKSRQNWIVMQGIVLCICFAGVIVASIIGLKSIQIIAGSFLALWTIEKMVEIPGDGFVPWVLKLMAASGVLYLIVTLGAPFYARQFIV